MKQIKLVLSIAIALFIFKPGQAQTENYSLIIEITDLKNNDGNVMIELLDKDENSVAYSKGLIIENKSTVEFKNLSAGTYAVQYYHDENSNDKMDTGNFGIPLEGYGFSNDARGFMGPPDFEDELFSLDQNLTMILETKN
jgi:uncharacterized protein (DUF2141 family)